MQVEQPKPESRLRRLFSKRPQSWFASSDLSETMPSNGRYSVDMENIQISQNTSPARAYSLNSLPRGSSRQPATNTKEKTLVEPFDSENQKISSLPTSIPARRTSRFYTQDPAAQAKLDEVLSSDRMILLSKQIRRSFSTGITMTYYFHIIRITEYQNTKVLEYQEYQNIKPQRIHYQVKEKQLVSSEAYSQSCLFNCIMACE
ncbi:hypothetical protein F4703DRAFT_1792855 [Phycomyces blakesleeanus]